MPMELILCQWVFNERRRSCYLERRDDNEGNAQKLLRDILWEELDI